ncbi:DUF2987 domain-containing protein [Thalassotalea sp. PS06]|uniref:DUF2987 domain-containing protein n=1 Tax=Thalassotalea sp. PS06 TaxID=2594005 RepID=UPI001163D9A6|nr:DUF2987 domain-containing protein [Thalassotalea sp. PS06]QDP01190.1 DUF2987 domain-containing protein [Thalassotalea sp. PS06]
MIRKFATLLVMGLFSLSAQALDLEYKGFYQRLDIIEENELDKITMGFYLVDAYNRERCHIDKAFFFGPGVNEKEIDIAADGRLQIPYDKELYDRFAVLRVNLSDPAQNCTLQMQIQVKDNQKTEFSFAELSVYREQMQSLVDEFGGFLWFMMPDVQGLNLKVASDNTLSFIDDSLKSGFNCEDLQCTLLVEEELTSNRMALQFSQPPVVISPWISKD